MSYRNPKAAPINTGAAVYEGIQKLAGDVYTFANEERDRKGKLIADSLAAQQAVDDDVNKMGLNVGEGTNNFETQIFEEAQAAKKKIAAQYEIMSRTFSSPETRAKAKAEISKLNKYPEGLVADLSTGKYLAEQYGEGLLVQPGETGSISNVNDINLLGVIKDMKEGGQNTKIETNAAGSRILVTKSGNETYRLNISNITNGLKNNPNQSIFNTVADDSGTTDNYLSALSLGGKNLDLAALVDQGILKKQLTESDKIGGKRSEIYTIDKEVANEAVSDLSTSLIDDPSSYTYGNSIWQDKIKGEGTLKQALGERDKDGSYKNQDAVLKKIRNYYVEQAVSKAGVNNGVSVQLAKPEKVEPNEWKGYLQDLITGNVNQVPTVNGYWEIKENNEKGVAGESDKVIARYVDVELFGKVVKKEVEQIPLNVKGKTNFSGWKTANKIK